MDSTSQMADFSESNFIQALSLGKTKKTPVWFMRQAGRSLPEYRAIRGVGSILDAVANPSLAAEITMQPVKRYGVDAAILYSDIIVPVHACGFGIDIIPGTGPTTDRPFEGESDLKRLANFDAKTDTGYVLSTIEILKKELEVPLIGFAGGPFTVASYLIEGKPSRNFIKTKQMMYTQPKLFESLLWRLTEITVDFLSAQAQSGVNAIQLFDSWVGALSPREYRRFITPCASEIFSSLSKFNIPMISFGTNTSELLGLFVEAGASAVGLDSNTEITTATKRLGDKVAIQGNLDPVVCLTSVDNIISQARQVLMDSAFAPGYVFNLGHGVLPETDPTKLVELVDFLHQNGEEIRKNERASAALATREEYVK